MSVSNTEQEPSSQASKWDKKYQSQIARLTAVQVSSNEGGNESGANKEAGVEDKVSFVLTQNQHLLPASGEALDLAAGLGHDAFFLADKGLQTWAYDISQVAVDYVAENAQQRGSSVRAKRFDIENDLLKPESFDVINVSRYLYRSGCNQLIAALKPGGLLFYQTFTQHKLLSEGPSNPDYLLQPRELLQLFSPLSLCFYREDELTGYQQESKHSDSVHRNYAYFVARKLY